MALRFPRVFYSKQILCRSNSFGNQPTPSDVPKGHIAVYVGDQDQKKRLKIPISFLHDPSFQELLCMAEEEFGYSHPMGALTLPCREDIFIDLTTRLNRL